MSAGDDGQANDNTPDSSVIAGASQKSSSASRRRASDFGSIAAEGDAEKQRLAKATARAVFLEPATVTPRRLALLGHEGLAAFVDEIRRIAKAYIERERNRPKVPHPSGETEPGGPGPVAPDAAIPAAAPTRRRKPARNPASFKAAPTPKVEGWFGLPRIDPRAMRFAEDVLVGCLTSAALLAVSLPVLRLILLAL